MNETKWWRGIYDHDPTYEEIFEKNGMPIPKHERLGAKKFPTKSDCFAIEKKEGELVCSALKKTYCQYGPCSFYKTAAQFTEER